MLSEGIEQLIHLHLLNIRNKIQQQSSIHRVFCLMVGGMFVNLSLHHSLACWRKIGRVDTNKGTIVTLRIYWVTSKESHFTHQVLSDNLLGGLPSFTPNIKTNCQKVILSFSAAFHFFQKSTFFFLKGVCYGTKQSLLYNCLNRSFTFMVITGAVKLIFVLSSKVIFFLSFLVKRTNRKYNPLPLQQ